MLLTKKWVAQAIVLLSVMLAVLTTSGCGFLGDLFSGGSSSGPAFTPPAIPVQNIDRGNIAPLAKQPTVEVQVVPEGRPYLIVIIEGQANVDVTASALGTEYSTATNSFGRATIHLVRNLGLRRFTSDTNIPLRVSVPNLNVYKTFYVKPSEFLTEYWHFDIAPYYTRPDATSRPAGYTLPGRTYRVESEENDWLQIVKDGNTYFIKSSVGEFVEFAYDVR